MSTKNTKVQVGKNIRYLRRKNLMTQMELAKLLNKSDTAIRLWELGKTEPDIKTLIKLSSIFKTPITTIVSDEDAFKTDFILAINGLSNEDLILLIGYANFLRGLKNGN